MKFRCTRLPSPDVVKRQFALLNSNGFAQNKLRWSVLQSALWARKSKEVSGMLLDCVWLVGKPGHDAEAFFITDISRNTGMAVKCIVHSDQSAQLACPLQVSSLLDVAGNVWETSLGQGKKSA